MNHASTEPHRVIVIELEPLADFQEFLTNYCDNWELVGENNLLMYTMNFLGVENNLSEAGHAMELHIDSFCRNTHSRSPYKTQMLDSAIACYLREMHRIFITSGMYGEDTYLRYAFGWWHRHDAFAAAFVPHSHIQHYPTARSSVVQTEPYGTHYTDVFKKVHDPDLPQKIYNFSLRNENLESLFKDDLEKTLPY